MVSTTPPSRFAYIVSTSGKGTRGRPVRGAETHLGKVQLQRAGD